MPYNLRQHTILTRILPIKIIKCPATSSERCKKFLANLKKEPVKYNKFREKENLRKRLDRKNRTPEQKLHDKELSRIRMKKYRIRQSGLNLSPKPVRPKTRQEVEKLRKYWREKKKEARSQWTNQKQRRENEKRKERYYIKKVQVACPNTNQTNSATNQEVSNIQTCSNEPYSISAKRKALSKVKSSLPKSPRKYAYLIKSLIVKASPRKKKELEKHGINFEQEEAISLVSTKVVTAIGDDIKSLKMVRNKKAMEKRKCFAKTLSILKKYRLLKPLSVKMGLNYKYMLKCSKLEVDNEKNVRSDSLPTPTVEAVHNYYERIDVSTELPYKKLVSPKSNKQKHVLTKTLQQVHHNFKTENKDITISYSTFTKLRPKHVLTVGKNKFNHCLCEYCTNIELKLKIIRKIKEIAANDLKSKYDILKTTLCEKQGKYYRKECIFRTCKMCGIHKLDERLSKVESSKKIVLWDKWENTKGTVVKEGQIVQCSRKGLLHKRGLFKEFLSELKEELDPFSAHLFIAQWQYEQFNIVRTNIPLNAIVLIMDFAENYTCIMQDEVQAAHWCHSQVTIHPIIAYYRCKLCNVIMHESMVVISDDMKHDAHAVQHFLVIVNKYLREQLQDIVLEIQWSDGAVSQYKSKTPFSDISFANDDFGFPVERNFFGSRHGKGPSDGLGGLVKQTVTRAVKSREAIISDAMGFYKYCLENLTISEVNKCCHNPRTFFFVPGSEINRKRSDRDITTVKGTRLLHSVKTIGGNKIAYRNISCYCFFCRAGEPLICDNAEVVNQWNTIILKTFNNTNTAPIKKSVAPIQKSNVPIMKTDTSMIKKTVALVQKNNVASLKVDSPVLNISRPITIKKNIALVQKNNAASLKVDSPIQTSIQIHPAFIQKSVALVQKNNVASVKADFPIENINTSMTQNNNDATLQISRTSIELKVDSPIQTSDASIQIHHAFIQSLALVQKNNVASVKADSSIENINTSMIHYNNDATVEFDNNDTTLQKTVTPVQTNNVDNSPIQNVSSLKTDALIQITDDDIPFQKSDITSQNIDTTDIKANANLQEMDLTILESDAPVHETYATIHYETETSTQGTEHINEVNIQIADATSQEELEQQQLTGSQQQLIQKDGFCKIRWGPKDEVYVVKIEEIDEGQSALFVKFMHPHTIPGYFFWPEKEDCSWESYSAIVESIAPPVLDTKKSTNRKLLFYVL